MNAPAPDHGPATAPSERPDRTGLRLMAVHAHPDDESSKGAASTAMYAASGARVMVVTLTGGERGQVLNPALRDTGLEKRLHEVREQEMADAARILGVEHRWLGFVDSGFPDGDPPPPLPDDAFAAQPLEEGAARLVALIREFRPHVITTYDETGGYPHPDHIRCHDVTVAAFEAAPVTELFPEAGPPWAPSKLYFHVTFSREWMVALHEAAQENGYESPFGERVAAVLSGDGPAGPVATTRVPCSEFFQVRDEALKSHATQIDPNGRWFALPLELQQQVWPTEDYHLARSSVPPSIPEDDLFAGIDPHHEAAAAAVGEELR
jgi:mycothiol S-conjugate amidase